MSNGEKAANEAICVKKGGFMWYFSLSSISMTRDYLWLLVSVSHRIGLAL